jgi:ABC-2 type transport system permease protein
VNIRRLRAIWQRVLHEIRRDRPSLALLFIAPIIITGLVAFIMREGQAPTVNAIVVNEAGLAATPITTAIQKAFADQGVGVRIATDVAAARAEIDAGTATVALILPSDFVASEAAGKSPTLVLLTKGLDSAADGAQMGVLQEAVTGAMASMLGAGGRMPTLQHQTLYGSPSADVVDNLAPAIVGFFAYFFVYILTGVSFLRERTGGTLERLLATPVTRGEIVGGYALGFGIFATVQVAILLLWALADIQVPALGPLPAFSLGLAIPMAGSPVLAFLVVVLLALGAVSLGIFLSTFARTELQVIQFIPIVLAPQFLLSGVLFPVSSLPDVLQPIVSLMPLSYAVDGLRQVFIKGADLGSGALQLDLLVLAAIAVFFAGIASLTIRREVV